MKLSEEGRKLLTSLHTVHPVANLTNFGLLQIGVKHLLTAAELDAGVVFNGRGFVKFRAGLSAEDIDGLLIFDLGKFELTLNQRLPLELEQHKFDALVLLIFDIGIGGFLHSKLLNHLDTLSLEAIPSAIRLWQARGRQHPRREAEVRLWLQGHVTRETGEAPGL